MHRDNCIVLAVIVDNANNRNLIIVGVGLPLIVLCLPTMATSRVMFRPFTLSARMFFAKSLLNLMFDFIVCFVVLVMKSSTWSSFTNLVCKLSTCRLERNRKSPASTGGSLNFQKSFEYLFMNFRHFTFYFAVGSYLIKRIHELAHIYSVYFPCENARH